MRPAEQALDHGGKVPLEEQGHLTMVVVRPAEQALDHGGKVSLEEQGRFTMVVECALRSRRLTRVVK